MSTIKFGLEKQLLCNIYKKKIWTKQQVLNEKRKNRDLSNIKSEKSTIMLLLFAVLMLYTIRWLRASMYSTYAFMFYQGGWHSMTSSFELKRCDWFNCRISVVQSHNRNIGGSIFIFIYFAYFFSAQITFAYWMCITIVQWRTKDYSLEANTLNVTFFVKYKLVSE